MNKAQKFNEDITIEFQIPLYVYNQLLEKSEYLSINPEKLAMLGLSKAVLKIRKGS